MGKILNENTCPNNGANRKNRKTLFGNTAVAMPEMFVLQATLGVGVWAGELQ